MPADAAAPRSRPLRRFAVVLVAVVALLSVLSLHSIVDLAGAPAGDAAAAAAVPAAGPDRTVGTDTAQCVESVSVSPAPFDAQERPAQGNAPEPPRTASPPLPGCPPALTSHSERSTVIQV